MLILREAVFCHGCIAKARPDCVSTEMCFHVTCDDGRHAPADGIIEPHGSIVDVALLGLHSVDMKTLDEHPSKCRHEEVMQEDGDDGAQELEGTEREKEIQNVGKERRI